MGFFDSLMKTVSSSSGMGSASLKSAYLNQKAPNGPGVYKISCQGKLMKVGKASDGLRKRFSDYYRGPTGGTAGLKYITESNRDDATVSWKECSTSEARKIETMWHDQAKQSGEELPWSDRR